MKVADRRRIVQPIISKTTLVSAARFLRLAPLASVNERTIVDELSTFARNAKRAARIRKLASDRRRRQKFLARLARDLANQQALSQLYAIASDNVIIKEVAFRLAQIHRAQEGFARHAAATGLIAALGDDRLRDQATRRQLLEVLSKQPESKRPLATSSRPAMEHVGLLGQMSPLAKEFVLSRLDLLEAVQALDERTFVTFICRTVSGLKVEELDTLSGVDLDGLRADPEALENLTSALGQHGLEVVFVGSSEVVAAGRASAVQAVVGKPLAVLSSIGDEPGEPRDDVMTAADIYVATSAGHVVTVEGPMAKWADHAVFFPPARSLSAVPIDATPPTPKSHHLDQAGIRRMLNCPSVGDADASLDGEGVKVAVVDSGVFAQHPALHARNAAITHLPMPAKYQSHQDLEGHGTAMAWNVLTCAPRAEILSAPLFPSPNIALSVVRDSDADVVVCSWELPYGRFALIEQRILEIVQRGKVVLAAAGNGTESFPGYLPDVISVGGIFKDELDRMWASSMASRYVYVRQPNTSRQVPDVCGPCGDGPEGVYFAMPCPAGSNLDKRFGRVDPPDGDGLGDSDGWWVGSGTSGATSLIAGVCALLVQKSKQKQNQPAITTDFVKKLLKNSSTVVAAQYKSKPKTTKVTTGSVPPLMLVDAARAMSLLSGP